MKKLIICIIVVASTCISAYETHEEIDNVKVNDYLFYLLKSVYPDCKYKIQEDKPSEFEFLINVTETEACAATLPKLTAKLDELKVIEHAKLTYRTVLTDKKLEAKNLYASLRSNYGEASIKAGIAPISNPDAWVRDNCERVSTHEKIDSCISILTLINNKVPEVVAENEAIEAKKNACNINVSDVQAFNIDSIDAMNTAQLKNVIKAMARIIQCRIK